MYIIDLLIIVLSFNPTENLFMLRKIAEVTIHNEEIW